MRSCQIGCLWMSTTADHQS